MRTILVRQIKRDDESIDLARCPQCKTWAEVDEDQLKGEISMICPECNWHGYITDA